MPKQAIAGRRGVILLMLLATILVGGILASVIANLITNQARFTHHQVSRVQAYYSALAAMNLAMENLRTGNWDNGCYALCNDATGGGETGCRHAPPLPLSCSSFLDTVVDGEIPYNITIVISPPDSNEIRRIDLAANFTYTP